MQLQSAVPVFKLYGEHEHWPTPDMVHCESIAARSVLHNWQIRPHQHVGLFQILYLRAGSATVQLDDQQREMQGGQVLMVPQMCIHGFQFSEDAVGHVVTLAYPLINQLTKQAGDGLIELTAPSMVDLRDDDNGRGIEFAFNALDREYRGLEMHRNLLIEFLLGSILIRLARQSSAERAQPRIDMTKSAEHFGKFSQLIEDNYQHQYPVAHYAGSMGITSSHLNAVCRQVASRSALELIHARMLLEAKRNLVYTSMTISVIAYAIGFSDPAYFTRFFKRQVGMSPKNFRKQPKSNIP